MLKKTIYYPPPEKYKKKKIPSLLLVAVMTALLIAGLPYARGFVIRNDGIELKPESIHAKSSVQAFLQNDERWAKDKLGESPYEMAGHGCLVCCIASAMVYLDIDTDPEKLNRRLFENNVYTDEGDIIWEKLKALGITHEYQNDFGSARIERLLKEGQLPIVKVKFKGSGVFHWVLIVGSDENDFFVLDSLNSSLKPVPLKTHGKVYAYRVLKRIQP